ncbi:hypothetical protein [Xenorhabdus griffiniae]|uniref:Virulence factor Evf domain-containing protein n=1 Tax=Xenorhabdus griffiniae TaxID=351672 RepID=A0ABY9XMY4_9GAMM|nr:hypothetical protein [Xenorhabdus griffiniae]MBD1227645.1 hypothetical protein [Xenorhabdus griffiniae]MBE8586280.1 hypothetical protein [Xenorhabdus griffiniae]WMV74285.1 hypothetical protein QL128_09985 [Xenorhabdus griffiniae]WNH03965.1 hypothetical protein QL112_009990 [Xenorhabdus griffiniae]
MDTEKNKEFQHYLSHIQQADQFFSAGIRDKFSFSDYLLSDTDGLVQFIITANIVDKASVIQKMNEIKKVQIALSSIAADHIAKYTHVHGTEYKTDIQFWGEIMAKLPLMSIMNVESQTYQHEMKGVSIATNLLQLIMDIILNANSPSLKSFSDFLQKQGDAIRLGLKRNGDHYSTLTLASVIEAIGVEDRVMYVPKIKLYKIDFDRTNSEVTSNCASHENINVEFTYSSCISLFNYQALENHEVKIAFDNFILKNQKSSIENSDNFFSGEFKTVLPKET